jgi:iron complex outermembrane receptor protein
MSKQQLLIFAGVAGLTLSAGGAAWAADPATPAGPTSVAAVSEVIVTADKAGLLERKPNDTVLGLTKPLIETPRSASLVSDTTIQRYGIQTINAFVDVSPSTYTASFYGVPGSLDVRGTLADNYFLGFKLIEDRGTYSTPIGDASQIQIVRGPPSPIYGPGKVGGFLNFIPKSAATESLSAPEGQAEITGGAYGLVDFNAQGGLPLSLGKVSGGVYAYGEISDGGSFYEGVNPLHQLGEISINLDMGGGWSVFGDTLLFHSTGDIQTPGWNRLTPQLIASQSYVTGQNTTLAASPGVPYLTPNQATPTAPFYPFNFTAVGGGLYDVYFGQPVTAPPLPDFQLNSPGAGTAVRLSPRNVFVGPSDFSKTFVPIGVVGIEKDLAGDSSLKFQVFYNGLDNQRFVSYGFPAWFRANTTEVRGDYDFKLGALDSDFHADTILGASFRYYQGRDMQSFDDGLIALDRRDLSNGATPTDTMCDPFQVGVLGDQIPNNCQGWEFDVRSIEDDGGGFVTTDITLWQKLDIVLGGRYDGYYVKSTDTGIFARANVGLEFDHPGPASASKDAASYTASATYKLGWGLMPYVTYASDHALEVQQAGDLMPSQILGNAWLSQSNLVEGGLKFQLLNHTLVGSVDGYRQQRTSLSGLNNVSQATSSTGFEWEARWLATKNLSFTFSGDSQHTEVLGPDTSTIYVPTYAVCHNNLACELNSWGGAFLVFDYAASPLGHPGNYELTTIPHSVISFYANYITDEHAWGKAGVTIGTTWVAKTSGVIVGAVTYPAYDLVNASAFYQKGPWEVDFNVDNLFNSLYFTPNSDATYVNVAVIPGVGREWRFSLKRKF